VLFAGAWVRNLVRNWTSLQRNQGLFDTEQRLFSEWSSESLIAMQFPGLVKRNKNRKLTQNN
jgi:hypothetical protein